jgi:hypothetical protein
VSLTDLDEVLADAEIAPPTMAGAVGRKCGRHQWERVAIAEDARDGMATGYVLRCVRCPAIRDEVRARRGKSSRRLGADQERRIERVYGPRKVGEFGDAVDHLGRLWKWQSKATRAVPPLWLAKISEPTYFAELPAFVASAMSHMDGIAQHLAPLVIRSYVRNGGKAEGRTRDWMFVKVADYRAEAGLDGANEGAWSGYMVIPGAWWLDHFGRDEPGL